MDDYCVLKVDSVKDSVKNRDTILFVPVVKCMLQEYCHLLRGISVLPPPLSVDRIVLSAMRFSFLNHPKLKAAEYNGTSFFLIESFEFVSRCLS